MAAYKIIDVSMWNGLIDWEQVKTSGVYGVNIRAGYGCTIDQKDKAFERNWAGAVAAGLHVGAYWYSYATTIDAAKMEANVFLKVLKGKKFDLPVYMDMEEPSQVKLSKSLCTSIVTAFCSVLEAAKYWVGVYSFDGFFGSNLDPIIQGRYSCWVARVEYVKPTYCISYSTWQCSWKAKVQGIVGDVDLNECYVDFPKNIKKNKLNGFTDSYRLTAVKDNIPETEAATSKNRLEAEGYTVDMIQI